ncbi:MAG: DNA primase [Pseudomonadota bacterium]
MRFTPTFLDEIRDRVPISSVIGRSVTWDKRKTQVGKGDFWACCPFHGEKSPSFHCEDRKGRYYCFGCGASGDHLRFMTEHNGLSFPEAVEQLAAEAGVPMPARDEQAERKEQERASLYDVMNLAQDWFQQQLQTADGAKARAYLRDRGLPGDIQQQFGMGFAPDVRNGLKQYLAGKGVTAHDMEQAGLVVHGEGIAVSYDRFRGRVMFPIHDSRGRAIAFGGRALSPDVPAKYLNSPETPLFTKGNIVYNHHRARKPASDVGAVIAAEGYMDVIALAAGGFHHAVAPLGTALTDRQLEIMWRMTPEPTLCFDGDKAGLKAAHRAADTALPYLKPGRSVRFALLPQGLDPDDLMRAQGSEAMAGVLEQARPLADILWMRETAGGTFDTPEKRAELEGRMRQLTSAIADETVRRHYQQDLRNRLEAFFGVARSGGQRQGFGKGGETARRGAASRRFAVSDSLATSGLVRGAAIGGQSTTMPPLRDAALIVGIINHPTLLSEFFEEIAELRFAHSQVSRLHAVILDAMATRDTLERQHVAVALERAGLKPFSEDLGLMCARSLEWHVSDSAAYEDAREGWLQALHLHHRAMTLHTELRAAERAFAEHGTQETYERLLLIRDEMLSARGTEVQIAGFGLSSGRPLKPL